MDGGFHAKPVQSFIPNVAMEWGSVGSESGEWLAEVIRNQGSPHFPVECIVIRDGERNARLRHRILELAIHRQINELDYPWASSEINNIEVFPTRGQARIGFRSENPVALYRTLVFDLRTDGNITGETSEGVFSDAIVFAKHPRASDEQYQQARDRIITEANLVNIEIAGRLIPPYPPSTVEMNTYFAFDLEMLRVKRGS